MDVVKVANVAAILTSVAEYGGQLAAVFHNYALIADKIPCGFEGAINILDATVAVLKQVLSLVKDEAEGKKLFSEEGLTYVQLLAQESANTLAKVEPIITEACLERKDRKARRKLSKKAAAKKLVIEVDSLSLKLDEKDFLEKVEKAKWSWATDDIEKCMERLYDLQLHLLLVFEVVTVGTLSKDLTSGKVNIQSIVTYYDRINRTADLVGIKAPKSRSTNGRHTITFSSSNSDNSSGSSDSDASSFVCERKKKPFMCGPPSPPPARLGNGAPPPPPAPPAPDALPKPPPKEGHPDVIIIDGNFVCNAKPPAYSETKVGDSTPSGSRPNSTLIGPVSTSTQADPVTTSNSETTEKTAETVYPTEKVALKEKDEIPKGEEIVKPTIPDGRLFKSSSSSLGFKLKSFFRSKESLAAEMARTLSDSESHLMAYVVQRHGLRQIPHSAFHTLEATHMKTILSQLNGNEWYKTFINLDSFEHASINRLLHSYMNGKFYERELVVLKVLEQNRVNAWMALIGELLRNRPFTHSANSRVLLAIVREKFVDGKPVKETTRLGFGPPLPPPFSAPAMPSIRPPPTPYIPSQRTKISDLKGPPPPPPGWPTSYTPGGPPPRLPLPPLSSTSPLPPPGKSNPTRTSDITSVTEYDANIVLTTYNEYTLRLSEPTDLSTARSWSRVAVTQESSEKQLVLQRVERFKRGGGNVIDIKLRLTEQQSGQVTRLMEDLKCCERDYRFEWTWAEISLYNSGREITLIPKLAVPTPAGWNVAGTATHMHLIAKRSLKPSYKALDVYNERMKPAPAPRPPVSTPIITLATNTKAHPKKKYVDSSSDSDSDSTYWSSDSSVGNVRRTLRRYRAKKLKKSNKAKYYYDSDSDSDEEEDVIAVKLQLKRGDDVVKVLLDRWTPEVESKGKGKAAA